MKYPEYTKYRLKCEVSGRALDFLKPVMKGIGRLFKVDFVSDRMRRDNS